MEDLYELLKKNKLTSPKNIFEFCEENKPDKILDICLEALITTTKTNKPHSFGSLFNFSASLTLSGGSFPCQSLSCRLNQVAQLAKFSSMYSDNTTIYNPFDFSYYFLDPELESHSDHINIQQEALNAFLITLKLKPLIERGFMTFSKTIYTICENCKKEKDKATASIYKELDGIAEKNILPLIENKVKIEYENNAFHLAGIKPLIGEDLFLHIDNLPELLRKTGKRVSDFKKANANNPFLRKIVGEAIDSLMIQKIESIESVTQTYLTNSIIEKTLLEKMDENSDSKIVNFFANGLPVVQDMPYENILEIRDSYTNEFKSFQDHVSDLITKAKTFKTQEEFNIFVKDKLEKQLKDLTTIQEEGVKKIRNASIAKGMFTTASIAVSVISHSAFPAMLAVAKAVYDCAELTFKYDDLDKIVQKNPLYFYYQLGQKN